MKIVAISDLQGQCRKIKPEMLPKGDMLLIAGDLGGWGTIQEMEEVNDWLKTLPYAHKITIGGNHDLALEIFSSGGKNLFTNATYLQNQGIDIAGIKIWGTPVSYCNPQEVPYFRAFADNEHKQCDMIPKDLDILLIHGPPYGILDQLKYSKKSIGSKYILEAIQRKKPRLALYGHIHESYGIIEGKETTFINCALTDERNELFKDKDKTKLMHEPVVFDYDPKTRQISELCIGRSSYE